MENIITDIPVIKLFMHNNRYFLYDCYTNSLLEVERDHYIELCSLNKIGTSLYKKLNKDTNAYNDIVLLINKGMLKYNFIKKVEHPETKNVCFLTDRCINDIVIQVTRDCNFRCRYCLYAGKNDLERHHESITMSWSIAKKSIDFLFDHSLDAELINISFYGGEPLLNFDLIVKAVEYANEKFKTKPIKYSMTINGSLLFDEVIDFVIKHSFDISISLDGPEEIQNKHRKFNLTGGNTFDVVEKNIYKIINNHREYFDNHVFFLPVFLDDENYEDVQKFFQELGVDEKKITPLQANLSGMDYIYSEYQLNTLNKKQYGTIRTFNKNDFSMIQNQLKGKNPLPNTWHHNGQCIPGIQRVFIDVYGNLYPCEKITEDKTFCIGNLNEGFDIEKIIKFLNIGRLTEQECKTCWAMRFCQICISLCNDIDKHEISRKQKLLECNNQKEKALVNMKYYIDSKQN